MNLERHVDEAIARFNGRTESVGLPEGSGGIKDLVQQAQRSPRDRGLMQALGRALVRAQDAETLLEMLGSKRPQAALRLLRQPKLFHALTKSPRVANTVLQGLQGVLKGHGARSVAGSMALELIKKVVVRGGLVQRIVQVFMEAGIYAEVDAEYGPSQYEGDLEADELCILVIEREGAAVGFRMYGEDVEDIMVGVHEGTITLRLAGASASKVRAELAFEHGGVGSEVGRFESLRSASCAQVDVLKYVKVLSVSLSKALKDATRESEEAYHDGDNSQDYDHENSQDYDGDYDYENPPHSDEIPY